MITVATDEDTFSIDADLSISLENLQALLEADTNIPPAQQVLYCNGNRLTEASKSLEQMGVKADDLLLLRSSQGSSTGAQQSAMAANASGGQSSRGANAYRLVSSLLPALFKRYYAKHNNTSARNRQQRRFDWNCWAIHR